MLLLNACVNSLIHFVFHREYI